MINNSLPYLLYSLPFFSFFRAPNLNPSDFYALLTVFFPFLLARMRHLIMAMTYHERDGITPFLFSGAWRLPQ